jgi:hypothetical protein
MAISIFSFILFFGSITVPPLIRISIFCAVRAAENPVKIKRHTSKAPILKLQIFLFKVVVIKIQV